MELQDLQPPTRIVRAPEPDVPLRAPPPNRILEVRLEQHQDVEWLWSLTLDGERYVSGYSIVDRAPTA